MLVAIFRNIVTINPFILPLAGLVIASSNQVKWRKKPMGKVLYMAVSMSTLLLTMNSTLHAVEIVHARSIASPAGQNPTPQFEGVFLNIQELELCNEVQTRVPEINRDRYYWAHSAGSVYNLESVTFKALKDNLFHPSFGKDQAQITINFQGKNIVPNSLRSNQEFTPEFNTLYDKESKMKVGRFLAFTDREARTGFADETGQRKQKILLAIFYYAPDINKIPASVTCEYASGTVDIPHDVERGKCVWVDQYSRAANSKPYCW
jgi:hypothetical protein